MKNSHFNTAMVEAISETMPNTNTIITIPDSNNKDHRMSVAGEHIISDASPRITITFHQISKIIDVPGKMVDPNSKEKIVKRILLDNISGQLHAGEIVALMGPSGSGKTTLLNVLAGRKLDGVSGRIWLNNQQYEKSMKRKFAYVLQEDIFFDELTVKQQLTFTALLRLPNDLTRNDKLAQVKRIIQELRLEQCANVPIKLISGGEKKRVNVATELLTNPSVVFLDGTVCKKTLPSSFF